MRIGLKRQRVILQRPVEVQDETGAMITTWEAVATVWAEIIPGTTRMRERLAGNQLLADVDTVIKVRWAPIIAAMDSKWRVVHGSTLYNIVGAANVQMRGKEFEIMCVSGMNNG